MSEAEARRIIAEAVELLGGARTIVGSPRHSFGPHSSDAVEINGSTVVVHYGEMSSPAIAVLGRWVFEIKESGLVLLDRLRDAGRS